MEKFDKNYIIGFVLLFVMYGSYMYFYPATPPAEQTQEKVVSSDKQALKENTKSISTVAPLDSSAAASRFGVLASAANGTASDVVLENKNLKVTLSTKGGRIKEVVLKNYRTYQDFSTGAETPMKLIDEANSDFRLEVSTNTGIVDFSNLYFTASEANANSALLVIDLGNGSVIKQKYSLPEEGFALDYELGFDGTDQFIKKEPVRFYWENKLKVLENDLDENRKAAQINLVESDGDFDDFGLGSTGDLVEEIESPVSWFSFKQKYFTSGFVSEKNPFTKMAVSLETPEEDSTIVKDGVVKGQFEYQAQNQFKFYFGPNEMKELKPVAEGFHKNLYLGYDIVKPINRFLFVPLFNWMEKFFGNYGFLIIGVVLLIKLVLTPLLYKSYVSSAKMRILAPDIAEIKEKVGDDQVKVQQETMKLYQQVGVSPLSGCVPMLLQMPILMSVFFLFPNMEMFRQQGFLWASDLSTYDAPIQWGFSLPLLGNHISMFVVLMTLSSLAFTYYNNQVTPDQPGPIDMKKISYIFPLVFFFVLNSFPAALSFYYLVSNLVTIAQQLIVKRFVDEDKIRGILEENKRNYATKPKKKNKFADYLQKQLEAQEEANKQKAKELKERKKK